MTDDRAVYDLFHETLDSIDISGPFQRLQLELTNPRAATRRRGRRILMTRNRLVLLAAAMVLLLGVSVLISTRLLSGLTPTSSVPAGDEVSTLLARPMRMPHLSAGATCPDGPYTDSNYGSGPVYGIGGDSQTTNWGIYWNVGLDVPVNLDGPIIIRGQDLLTGRPMVIVGQYGIGPVHGHDVIGGNSVTQYTAALIDTTKPPQVHDAFNGHDYIQWRWLQGFPFHWSGCVGFQADGANFTEDFYSSGNET